MLARIFAADDIPITRRVAVRSEAQHGLKRDVPIEAAVIPEDELVEVRVDVLAAEPVIGAQSPTLQQREHPVNPWQGDMACHLADHPWIIHRHIKGEDGLFPCIGGYRYFYLDWNLDIWRCEAWHEPLGSIFDFDHIPEMRDRCTNCAMSCYRDTSVLMHAGVAALDAAKHVRAGRLIQAAVTLFNRGVVASLGAAIETAR